MAQQNRVTPSHFDFGLWTWTWTWIVTIGTSRKVELDDTRYLIRQRESFVCVAEECC